MYCPRCAAQNRPEQKYCRQCGLALPAVRLAAEGRVDEALAGLKRSEGALSGGAVTLLIFLLIALVNFFFSSEKSWGMLFNMVLGLLIAGPIIFAGLRRLERAMELLEAADQPARPALDPTRAAAPAGAAFPPAPDTDPLSVPAPRSVTEQTTFNLKTPDQ